MKAVNDPFGKGLEVPCPHTYEGKPALIKEFIMVLVVKKRNKLAHGKGIIKLLKRAQR